MVSISISRRSTMWDDAASGNDSICSDAYACAQRQRYAAGVKKRHV
jgi:hypothetical protein